MKNNVYKGYIASRPIRDLQIPQRIQNLVIRTYAEKKQKKFSLSATEYIMDHCHMMLQALVKEAKQYEAIVFYSLFMLPESSQERMQVYKDCLDQGVEIHFAFEELAITSFEDIQLIEDIILAKDINQNLDPSSPTWEQLCRS